MLVLLLWLKSELEGIDIIRMINLFLLIMKILLKLRCFGAMKIYQITIGQINVLPKILFVESPFLPNSQFIELVCRMRFLPIRNLVELPKNVFYC